MKHRNRFLSAASCVFFPAIVLVWCCTKPTESLVITVTPDILTYTATLQFTDASQAGTTPAGLTVALEGADADAIYDYSGSKDPKLINGMLTLGVHPQSNPVNGSLSFTIKASADKYLPVNIPVEIGATNKNQNFQVQMINLSKTPAGVAAVQPVAAISNGTAATAITAATSTSATTTTTAGVTVPSGVQFKDASGKTITGSAVTLTLAAFDPAQPTAMQSLPGGQVQLDVSGGTSSEVFFQPAGFATINMQVNGTAVRQFSAPVSVGIGLNNTVFNPLTNKSIQPGDVVDIYSYQVENGKWTYETAVPISAAGGKLSVNFATSHLTTFLANVRSGVRPCNSRPLLVFDAPAISNGSSDQFIIDIYPTGTGSNPAPILSQYLTLHDNDSLELSGVPAGDVQISIFKVDYDHYLLGDYKNRGTKVADRTLNVCAAGTQPTAIAVNYTPGNYLTGTGAAVCPNDNTRKYLPPNGAQVYYKKSGTKDTYRILGVVVKSAVSTTQLVPGQRYDIMGNYGGQQVGKNNFLIVPGRSFLDSTYVIMNGSSFCK